IIHGGVEICPAGGGGDSPLRDIRTAVGKTQFAGVIIDAELSADDAAAVHRVGTGDHHGNNDGATGRNEVLGNEQQAADVDGYRDRGTRRVANRVHRLVRERIHADEIGGGSVTKGAVVP